MPRKRKEPVEPVAEIEVFREEEIREFARSETGKPFALRYAYLRASGVEREQAARTAQLWLAGELPGRVPGPLDRLAQRALEEAGDVGRG